MLKRKLAELLSVDLRSLAALRVGLGLYMMIDLFYRSMDLEAMYTDFGSSRGASSERGRTCPTGRSTPSAARSSSRRRSSSSPA